MTSDADQVRAIKSQSLQILAEITASPKPTYDIDGERVAWNDYLERLRETVEWCDRQLQAEEPYSIRSRGRT